MRMPDMKSQDVDTFQLPILFGCAAHVVGETVEDSITYIVGSSIKINVKVRRVGLAHVFFKDVQNNRQC